MLDGRFLESKLNLQLNQPGRIVAAGPQQAARGLIRVADHSQGRQRSAVVRQSKIGMIEQVEKLKTNS